mmetsp:Transcript_16554/g.38244  ORF Transcript_16554/g.38244 Transcript_16554/m.38244 type:complete len:248 (-) Transcript_16554:496-1239(-)
MLPVFNGGDLKLAENVVFLSQPVLFLAAEPALSAQTHLLIPGQPQRGFRGLPLEFLVDDIFDLGGIVSDHLHCLEAHQLFHADEVRVAVLLLLERPILRLHLPEFLLVDFSLRFAIDIRSTDDREVSTGPVHPARRHIDVRPKVASFFFHVEEPPKDSRVEGALHRADPPSTVDEANRLAAFGHGRRHEGLVLDYSEHLRSVRQAVEEVFTLVKLVRGEFHLEFQSQLVAAGPPRLGHPGATDSVNV